MSTLHTLAATAGLARIWWDAGGAEHVVSDESLITILSALGYPAHDEGAQQASLDALAQEHGQSPHFLSTDVGVALALPPSLCAYDHANLWLENGGTRSVAIESGLLQAIAETGYHRLRIGGHELVLAVTPARCVSLSDLPDVKQRKLWGTAIQIPSLQDKPGPYGDFADLLVAVRQIAALGGDAVAISPAHAPPASAVGSFSPYSPSSRQFLNPILAALPGSATVCATTPDAYESELIDWPASLPQRYKALRKAFQALSKDECEALDDWVITQGVALQRQALFDALSLHLQGSDWRAWPIEYRNPQARAGKQFAASHEDEITFQLYAQWLTDRSLGAVQAAAKAGDMALGLIADLAVGVDPGGSDAWAMQGNMLSGLTVGAPPDPLGPDGQNWNLGSFSPSGLQRTAFEPWIAMLRASLRHAGGVRIDHAFGLARLWVVPEGARAGEGAYLSYPFSDMLRILALESHRAGAVIIGEDLGTRPPGFVEPVAQKAILGMRVLWFERNHDGFLPAAHFPEQAVAMTATHDTATIAGWWTGRDLDWNRRLNRGGNWEHEKWRRGEDRTALWSMIGSNNPQPSDDAPAPVVEAAIEHLGTTPSVLAIVPLEDLLGLEEQPNVPGTIDEHPNWRRRMSGPLTELLADPATARRIAALIAARSR